MADSEELHCSGIFWWNGMSWKTYQFIEAKIFHSNVNILVSLIKKNSLGLNFWLKSEIDGERATIS